MRQSACRWRGKRQRKQSPLIQSGTGWRGFNGAAGKAGRRGRRDATVTQPSIASSPAVASRDECAPRARAPLPQTRSAQLSKLMRLSCPAATTLKASAWPEAAWRGAVRSGSGGSQAHRRCPAGHAPARPAAELAWQTPDPDPDPLENNRCSPQAQETGKPKAKRARRGQQGGAGES